MSPCGCRVEHVAVADAEREKRAHRIEDEFAIHFCPRHAAVDALVAALERLRPLSEAATAGEWAHEYKYHGRPFGNEDGIVVKGRPHTTADGCNLRDLVVGTGWYDGIHLALSQENAAFIVAAVNEVRRLLTELGAG